MGKEKEEEKGIPTNNQNQPNRPHDPDNRAVSLSSLLEHENGASKGKLTREDRQRRDLLAHVREAVALSDARLVPNLMEAGGRAGRNWRMTLHRKRTRK